MLRIITRSKYIIASKSALTGTTKLCLLNSRQRIIRKCSLFTDSNDTAIPTTTATTTTTTTTTTTATATTSANLVPAPVGRRPKRTDSVLKLFQSIAIDVGAANALESDIGNLSMKQYFHIIRDITKSTSNIRQIILEASQNIDPTATFEASEVASSLYALRYMNHDKAGDILKFNYNILNKVATDFTADDLCTAMFGLRWMDNKDPIVRNILDLLTSKIDAIPSNTFTPDLIAKALYGIRSMSSKHPGIHDTIRILTKKFRECNPDVRMSDKGFSRIVHSFQNIRLDRAEPKDLLVAILDKVNSDSKLSKANNLKSTSEQFNSTSMSNCIVGLKSMYTEIPEVRQLLTIIVKKISDNQSSIKLSSYDIVSSLSGLQNMDNDYYEVTELLRVITPLITDTDKPTLMNNHGILLSIYGLKNMDCRNSDVRTLVGHLAKKLRTCKKDRINTKAVIQALFALHHMNSSYAEVLDLLKELTILLNDPVVNLSHNYNSTGFALFGCYNITSDSVVAQQYIKVITKKIAEVKVPLPFYIIAMGFNGMRLFNSKHAFVDDLLKVMYDKLKESIATTNATAIDKSVAITSVYSSDRITQVLYGLQNMSYTNETVQLVTRDVLTMLKELNPMDAMTTTSVCNALHGMKGMSCEVPEALEIMQLLVNNMTVHETDHFRYTAQLVATSLSAFRNFTADPIEVRNVFVVLTRMIYKFPNDYSIRRLITSLYGLKRCSSEYVEVRDLVKALITCARQCDDASVMTEYTVRTLLCGFSRMTSEHEEIREALAYVTGRLNNSKNHINISSSEMRICIAALGNMNTDHTEVADLLKALAMHSSNKDEVPSASNSTNR